MQTGKTRRHTSIFPFFHFSISLLAVLILNFPSFSQDFGRRQRTFDVGHYRIAVAFDEAARRVDGETEVTLQPLRTAIDTVTLDAVGMSVSSVTSFVPGEATGEALRWTSDSARLHIHLSQPLRHG
ncbi:MAG: hypothetical protein KFF77_05730, partial [Bacteroidetes bacterium]|nr:hypothetical protein [Bacteroidota bacterium]